MAMVFELNNQGETLTGIAEALTSAGVPTKSGKLRWSTATIGTIRRQTFYEGVYYNADNELRRYEWEAILRHNMFRIAQTIGYQRTLIASWCTHCGALR